ncbi:OPT oligopeptide transporter [Cerioporus squamosus]|nr:OPT oligopeptide transporter [Cerioporus squamosus]
MEFDFEADEDEDSPYPEVRASPLQSSQCLLLLAHPLGKVLALTMPIRTFRLPRWLGGYEFSLNPGPWNIKEHALVYIMANVSIGVPTALNAVVVAELNYGVKLGYGFNALLILATQLTGFSLAGLCRRYLNLIVCTLLNTLHAEEEDARGGLSRFKFFCYATVGAFFWFFPQTLIVGAGYLFTALSIFSFICWAKPNDVVVNQLFGVSSGLGMSILTFDWSQITWIGSPLMVPWWAEVQVFTGFFLIYWILCPILYYNQREYTLLDPTSWDLAYFPMMANNPYDRYGKVYDVTRVLTDEQTFDQAPTAAVLPASYAITYLVAFALSSAMIVHTVLYHGRTVIHGLTQTRIEKDDIHAKLMRAYPEVPDWWYLLTFVACFSLAIVTAEVWHTEIPVWALLLAIALPVVYMVPSGYVYALTGQNITINLLAQIIPGMILPGKPLPNMIFKAYAVQTLAEGTAFVQDLKLGHYVKLPPRATFSVQLVATTLVGLLQVGVKEWMFSHIPDICQPGQKDFLTCPHNQVLYTTSAIWGLIGPARQFGTQSIYHPQLYAIAIGGVLPLPFWYWQRRWPNKWNKFINLPIILNGIGLIPPATGINYSSWFLLGFIFQFVIRRRNFVWWSKFNYVLTAAFDCGTVLSVLFIFFTLQFPKGGINLNWWGNTVYQNTADYKRVPLRDVPAGGIQW